MTLEPVEQILAELAVGDALLEIGVGRGDDADVDALRPRVADRQHLALLEEPQQLRLHVERQVADLVEEERAADRGPQHAGLIGDRAGEAAAAVAEQLAVGQLARRARAVVGQEHVRAARRSGVNRARDEVLAGAALAGDQHGQVVALQPLNLIGDALHRGAGADESRAAAARAVARARPAPPPIGRSRAEHSSNPCRSTAQSVRKRCSVGQASGREVDTTAKRGAVGVAADRLD